MNTLANQSAIGAAGTRRLADRQDSGSWQKLQGCPRYLSVPRDWWVRLLQSGLVAASIAGAALLQVPELMEGQLGMPVAALLAAVIVAAVSGVLAIRTFLAMLERRAFHNFGVYCWIVGGAFLAWLALH